jgi:hypothetical protein
VLNFIPAMVGALLVLAVLWETFETIVLPRRVTRQFRMTRLFYRYSWIPWRALARVRKNKKKRDAMLSYYGPLSLLMLLAFWAITMVFGFALIHYGDGEQISGVVYPNRFGNALYLSGTTLFTLGLGDVIPASPLGRFVTVLEGGIGFGFLALVIGYLPVLYQSFSRREVTISLLDARAGSPPTAIELIRRNTGPKTCGFEALTELLAHWESWAAELMESHLSYPVLAYFRSQHDNQSWIASLTAVLDVCALAMVGVEGMCQYQARMTFAIARHALVDLSQVFGVAPEKAGADARLSSAELVAVRYHLTASGFRLASGGAADAELKRLRELYEPYALALAHHLMLDLPPWIKPGTRDNWETTAWGGVQSSVPSQHAAADDHA